MAKTKMKTIDKGHLDKIRKLVEELASLELDAVDDFAAVESIADSITSLIIKLGVLDEKDIKRRYGVKSISLPEIMGEFSRIKIVGESARREAETLIEQAGLLFYLDWSFREEPEFGEIGGFRTKVVESLTQIVEFLEVKADEQNSASE